MAQLPLAYMKRTPTEADTRNIKSFPCARPSLFKSIISGYLASPEFGDVRDRTKDDYMKQLAKIERAFGDLPLDALDDPLVSKVFLDWRGWHGIESSPS